MLSRFMLGALLFAACAPAFAFYAQPAGYTLSEYTQSSGTGGIVWDPAGSDFYASHSGGVRRFDVAGSAFSATALFPAPASIPPAAYAFFDALAIDPASPNDFYVSYSGNFSRLYKLSRTGPDAATVVTSVDYSTNGEYIYQLRFVPDNANVPLALRGQLVAQIALGFSGQAAIYLVNRTTLALTKLIDVTGTQASGPFTVDARGNFYAVVPTSFGISTGAELLRFDAALVAAAVTGTPVAASQGSHLIEPADDEWNITSVVAREEGGSTFLYYSTQEHASVYRLCVQTGESRQFMQGFGGVADGYPAHFAVNGGIAFSSDADDFHPAGGGAVRMVVPFSVSTLSFGSYRALYMLEPEPVNVAVASLVVTQQPAGINNGLPFSFTVEARNSGGTAILSNVGVVVSVNGLGELAGFTIVSKPGNALVLDGLTYTAATLPETITLTVEVAGNPTVSVTTANIQVVAPAAALAVTAEPSGVKRNQFFALTAQLRNAGGTLVQHGPDAAREVSVFVQSGPGAIWGDTTITATGGVAHFDSLLLDATGSYTLRLETPGLPPQTLNVSVGSSAAGDSDSDSDGSGCAAANGGYSALALLALLFAATCVRARRRAAGAAR